MDNKQNVNTSTQPEKQQKPQWYDAVIHIFRVVLEFNQIAYTTKKVSRL